MGGGVRGVGLGDEGDARLYFVSNKNQAPPPLPPPYPLLGFLSLVVEGFVCIKNQGTLINYIDICN